MSSSDFQTKLVYDSSLNDISDKITYGIRKGGADVSFQSFPTSSATASSINFSINPPSESTCVDRDVIIDATVRFKITIGSQASPANIPAGESVWQYGLRESLQSWPLNKLFTTVTLSCNNVSTSVNNSDVLPGLLRCLDPEYSQKWYGGTPTYLDNYALFSDAVGKQNNPMADYGGAGYNDCRLPRGTHELSLIPIDAVNITGINRWNAGARVDASPMSGADTNYWVIGCSVRLREPLFCSPMLFGDSKFNQAAFLGINNFQVVISVDTQCRRFFSSGIGSTVPYNQYNVSLFDSEPFQNMQIQMKFLTAPLPMVLPNKSSLPYMSYVAYKSSNYTDIALNQTNTLNINSLQLEVIPDKLIIFVQNKLSNQNVRTPDSFLEITSVSVTFGSKSGSLSNASQYQLWKLSRKNGCQQDWHSWKGLANKYTAAAPYSATYATTGSVLILDPSMDFGLSAPYLANGSIGQYSLQIQLGVKRNSPKQPDINPDPGVVGFSPEVVVIACRSGLMVTSAGQSTLTTNMLSSQIVTDALESDKEPMGTENYQRLVGGAQNPASDMPAEMNKGYGAKSGGARSGGARYSKLSALAL